MKIKHYLKLNLLSLFFIFSLCSCSPSSKSIETVEKREFLKQYALCKCLVFAIPNDTFLSKDLSLNVYKEIANYSDNVYSSVDSIIVLKVKRIETSTIYDYSNRKAILKFCINDFYKSPYLDSLVKKYDKFITTPNEW
jgi:hypothetical protein